MTVYQGVDVKTHFKKWSKKTTTLKSNRSTGQYSVRLASDSTNNPELKNISKKLLYVYFP